MPKGVKTFNVGDWVTIVKEYAEGHAMDLLGPGRDGVVIKSWSRRATYSQTVTSMLEWGYEPQPYTKRSEREEWESGGQVRSARTLLNTV